MISSGLLFDEMTKLIDYTVNNKSIAHAISQSDVLNVQQFIVFINFSAVFGEIYVCIRLATCLPVNYSLIGWEELFHYNV